MQLYLVQHGESKSKVEDPERPLTDKGRKDAELVARYISERGIKVAQILHSGRPRAKQTAEIFARYLLPPKGFSEGSGLAPLDEPQMAKQLVEQAEKSLMIVGRLPHLSRLTSLLILGFPDEEIIKFRMGGVICLSREGERWSIKWTLVPELVQR